MSAATSAKPSGAATLELVARAKAGDALARAEVVRANMGFVYKLARRWGSNNEDVEDLAQQGAIGLLAAIDRFDCELGRNFLTYAAWWVKCRIIEYAQNDRSRGLAGAAHLTRNRWFLKRRYDRLVARGADPDLALVQVAEASGHSAATLRSNFERIDLMVVGSLDAPVRHEDGSRNETTLDSVASELPDPGEVVDERHRGEVVRRVVLTLRQRIGPRARAILDERLYVVDGEDARTLLDIGDHFGCSKECVRQVEAMLADVLRRAMRDGVVARDLPGALLR